MACPALTGDAGFVTATLTFIDCQAGRLGAFGYQALATPGSITALVLTGFLTLFVAGFGFRMLMGETPGVRDGVMAVAKIAFVIALATAWVPYRTLVYDVVLRGPSELAVAIGAPAGLPGTTGDLAERLDLVDTAFIQLNDLGIGRPRAGEQAMRNRQVIGSDQVVVEPVQGNPNPVEPYGFALARLLFLAGAVGAFGAVRLVAGLLLALGPLFVAFALFDATRGLFEGWLRGLGGACLGAIATTILLACELAMVETWIADLLSQRLSGMPVPRAAVELVVVTFVFDLILLAGLAVSFRVMGGLRLPWRTPIAARDPAPVAVPAARASLPAPIRVADDRNARALAIADGIAATQRREAAAVVRGARGTAGNTDISRATVIASGNGGRMGGVATAATGSPGGQAPLGHSFQRRARNRTSASAGRRDGRA